MNWCNWDENAAQLASSKRAAPKPAACGFPGHNFRSRGAVSEAGEDRSPRQVPSSRRKQRFRFQAVFKQRLVNEPSFISRGEKHLPKPGMEEGKYVCKNPAPMSQPPLLPSAMGRTREREDWESPGAPHVSGSGSQRDCSRIMRHGTHPGSPASALHVQRSSKYSLEHLGFQHDLLAKGPCGCWGRACGNADLPRCCSGLDSFTAEVAIFADLTSGSQQPVQATLVQSPFVSRKQTFHS